MGPCAFCDHPDARHRVIDAIDSRIAGGEDRAEVLEDYDYTEEKYERIKKEVDEA